MKHLPFQSSYLQNFEVVEERQRNVRLYPHTEQLPKLLRAVKNEFFLPLPPRIKRVDERGDGFHKFMLNLAAMMFCNCINASRPDRVRLLALVDANLVTKVSVVQQITETAPLGKFHRFRFYAGEQFFPEVYLSGKRLAFADHVLTRFSERVPNKAGEDLSNLLLHFYSQPLVSMSVGRSKAFVVPYRDGSILAFTFKESADEFFITTCLTANEMNSVEVDAPVDGFNLHYGASFTKPRLRNWSPLLSALEHYKCWRAKTPPPPPFPPVQKNGWFESAAKIKELLVAQGNGPGSSIRLLDQIPGPCCLQYPPGATETFIDELPIYKSSFPEHDWDAIFASEGDVSDARQSSA